ncbi:DUF2339 domain-containing protein [Kordiimonas pumila]|uniref:DUF2339 domain-containing protein n=1 Tax=Kordiimonas pumila TaxID=2161677 RepID=A0ABV7D4P8_9PROT|nr:DUF2339 domain-containing protein [Kordiimonas pumila]
MEREQEPCGSTNGTQMPERMEGDLSSKWMMWIGGIALAFGGAFMVKYSIDSGLLHPVIRVSIGAVFGLVLLAFGEWVRRKQQVVSWLKDRPNYIPGAVAAGGLFTLFASVYSAYALYELLSSTLTFAILALVSLGASWLARMHGRYFAYIGLVAGMAVPLMVSANVPSAWGLFPYLLAIIAASLWGARQHRWTDITVASLVIASGWVVSWIATNWHAGDILPVGLFVLALGGINQWMLRGASSERTTDSSVLGLFPSHPISILSDCIMALCAILLVGMVRLEHYSLEALLLAGSGLVGLLYAAVPVRTRSEECAEYDTGFVIGLLGSLFLLATWHLPSLANLTDFMGQTASNTFAHLPIKAPGFEVFLIVSVGLAGLVGIVAYSRLGVLFRKGLWASIGAGYPIIILLIDYWRMDGHSNNVPFAAISFVMAVLFAIAAEQCNRKATSEWRVPLAVYAAGAAGALSLTLAILLEDAWLSFALATEVLALGFIWKKTEVKGLRTLAIGLAAIVLVRLFFNSAIFGYGDPGAMPVINWLWYGYGLTAVMFAYAAKLFGDNQNEDSLVSVLKAGSALLLIAFTTLEIRVLVSDGNHLLGDPTSLEAALQTINWTAAGVILYWQEQNDNTGVLSIVRKLMTVVSVIGLIVAGGLFNNIFFRELNVGEWPIVNLQLLQFFVPAALYAAKVWLANKVGEKDSMVLYGLVSLLASFEWVTLEVRHIFYPSGGTGPASDWECYAYSAAWLLYAVTLMIVGMRFDVRKLRMVGVGLLAVVVVKVFVFDMSHLEGIARALSFMGLGVVLIATGYLYQYFRHIQLGRIIETNEAKSSDKPKQ